MRLIFMGTPDFATHALKSLLAAGHDIACVYSQPPRPAGRGQEPRKSPVQVLAESLAIPVRTPMSFKPPEEQKAFADLKADAAVVVAYGLLLPKAILDMPRYGCINIHASLLPRWRGAAPIQRAIMAGDGESGVTIMRMDEGLDTGPMLCGEAVAIAADETASSLHDRLAALGAHLVVEALVKPDSAGTPQPAVGVTYAKKITKAETRIDFARSAHDVRNHVHGLSPFPGAWTIVKDSRVKVLKAHEASGEGMPGTAIDNHLTIACGRGAIQLLEVQREGKGAMAADDFLRGLAVPAGTVIG
jgi:methionyl-tRNA formyltransferase